MNDAVGNITIIMFNIYAFFLKSAFLECMYVHRQHPYIHNGNVTNVAFPLCFL